MGKLRHRTAPGSSYFVTTKTWGNRNLFQVIETAEIVVEVLLRHRAASVYLLHEFVLMPNHLHLLLTPSRNTSLEKAMQLIKGGSSYEIHKRRGSQSQVWQPGFHESTIRDTQDFQIRAKYIRLNPVEARLVAKPEDWPYSSARETFSLDPWPVKGVSSAAKAAVQVPRMSELKLRPPKELAADAPQATRNALMQGGGAQMGHPAKPGTIRFGNVRGEV